MRKIVILAIAVLMAVSCGSENSYTIKGVITGNSDAIVDGKVYLTNRDRSFPIRDTAQIKNGKFVFTGTVKTPEQYVINIDGLRGGMIILLDNAEYTINAVDSLLKDAEVKGGETFELAKEYSAKAEAMFTEEVENALNILRNRAAAEADKLAADVIYSKFMEDHNSLLDSMILAHPLSQFSLYYLADKINEMELDSLQSLVTGYKALPEYAENRTLAAMDDHLQKELSLSIGNQAPEFTMNDTNGNPVALSDVYKKGKVTMIDFWAGWCGPCRNFNPTLVKIYNEYHAKGFEIIGVSLDRNRQEWLDAIKTDKLTWTNVSDLSYWNSDAAKLYNVRFIPQNVFVDSEGKIIARRLEEGEIVDLLNSLL